jgi:hypothetical protein
MRVWVRTSFTVGLGARARANATGTVVLGGRGYTALVLLALALTACSGGGQPAATPATTAALAGTGPLCVTSSPSGHCGPYRYAADTNSNGYNTHVGNNCWADPSCVQTLTVANPGDWQVTATQPAGNGSVRVAPEIGQQFNNWCSNGRNTWSNFVHNGCPSDSGDTPISALSQLTSRYAESTPHNSQTIAEWAWDNWLSNDAGYDREVMVWVDVSGRCNRGSFGIQVHAPVTIAGQHWTPHEYPHSSEFIWTLDGRGGPGSCAQQAAGTVNLLALFKWMQANGFAAPGAAISLIDGVWEICSTGGVPETFRVSSYSITARARMTARR